MTQLLESLIVRDFRSIVGEIRVPLDAPVVLIHAANAVGKTSVMSAIELGLTGRLPSFERVDIGYLRHLTNKSADRATLALAGAESPRAAHIAIDAEGIGGQPLLPENLHQFFSERCYLGQATLSRLLEWYAPLDSEQDSALALFVKDLLGVDRLDALIDGLHMAGHVARIRTELPRFREIEEEGASLETSSRTSLDMLESLRLRETEQGSTVLSIFFTLSASSDPNALAFPERVEAAIRSESEERDLSKLTSQRLQLATMSDTWTSLAQSAGERNRREIEVQAADAQRNLEGWERMYGRTLAKIIERLEKVVTNIPNPGVADPTYAHTAATLVVTEELERCTRQLAETEENRQRLADVNKRLSQEKQRLDQIVGRISRVSEAADGLAKVLGELLPYIHSNDCPVCDRDYSEISSEPLANKVSSHISKLSQEAGFLRTLSSERNEAERILTSLGKERNRLLSGSLSESIENDLRKRRVELADAAGQLRDSEAAVARGTGLRKAAADADRTLAVVRKRDRQGSVMRQELAMMAERLDQPPPARSETIEQALQRLASSITTKEAALEERAALRTSLEVQWNRLLEIRKEMSAREQYRRKEETHLRRLRSELQLVEERTTAARRLSRAALRAKATIVKRVFTESLNKTWRELFIRLAPDEAFVPRFTVPEVGAAAFRIELETLHRDGGIAGSPQAMLSTGNLNTAALALFLALNMSVEARVPLLMLDDPVQSMDEVHTAQLAALLRMLSKGQQSRQIIIAVHERSLFDYLAFELAPSFAGDTLITVELDRTTDGATTAESRYHEYKPETAVA